ncbi:MAG: recombinase family protein [Alphaproteobacteria bacterium]|nr:recombinase family protein [Alphaproteobacteria bacterium]
MILSPNPSKVTADHLKRNAYLYIRQSTLKQVMENTESTKRQYDLRQKGLALGWQTEQIIVIDTDQGQSGAQAADREGFQRLVAEVGLGKAGIVMGLEVSRLARNSMDWHRLLELCAMSHTLILDEEGVYDPNQYNDRLLLGLKGALSEAELHVLKARLQGGVINKAKRGELKMGLPIGFVYTGSDKVIRDPNQQIQKIILLFFELFRQTGSACAVVKAFRERQLLFPTRLRAGANRGEVVWKELTHTRVLRALHNPRYAGIFAFGRIRTVRQPNGDYKYIKIPKEDWPIFIPDVHEAYITQEDYENNMRRLKENFQAYGGDRPQSPPREGPALLQSIILCGKCGKGMTLRYHIRKGQSIPDYVCQREGVEKGGQKPCQVINGELIDKTVGELLIEMVTPTALEVALAVQQEVENHYAQVQKIYQQRIEEARYEADLARRRYRQVDPDNRLVASTLEAEWDEKLKLLEQAQVDYQDQLNAKKFVLSEKQKQEVLALTQNFEKLWRSPETPHRERKRIVRLLIEDVTLHQDKEITLQIRFKGGTSKTLALPRPMSAPELFVTSPHIIAEIDHLLEEKTEAQIVDQFNKQGLRTPHGLPFTIVSIQNIRLTYHLKSRYDRLREKGFLTRTEVKDLLQTDYETVRSWKLQGALAYEVTGGYRFLYYPLDDQKIEKLKKQAAKPNIPLEVDRLLDENTNSQIAKYLNEQGFVNMQGNVFTHQMIWYICYYNGFKSHYDRLREKGFLTRQEVAKLLGGVNCSTIKCWEKQGRLDSKVIDKNHTLYHPLDEIKIENLKNQKYLKKKGM